MPEDVIPEDVRSFVLENIDTVAQLEGLLLFRANRGAAMKPEEIAARLYISDEETEYFMNELAARGLLAKNSSGLLEYWPKSPHLEEMVNKLAEVHAKYLVPLTQLIHSKPKTRFQKFADAFRIRKDKP